MNRTQWFEATVAPVRDGFYDVRVAPQRMLTPDGTWRGGEWNVTRLTPDQKRQLIDQIYSAMI